MPVAPGTGCACLCRRLRIPLRHHDAGSDALACARIVLAAQADGWLPGKRRTHRTTTRAMVRVSTPVGRARSTSLLRWPAFVRLLQTWWQRLDTMRARIVKADEARAAQVAAAVTEAWDALVTHAAKQAAECRHGAELAERTRRPARRPRAVGPVIVRTRPGRRNPPALNCRPAAAGRVCHPEGRSGAEDGAAVDTPGS